MSPLMKNIFGLLIMICFLLIYFMPPGSVFAESSENGTVNDWLQNQEEEGSLSDASSDNEPVLAERNPFLMFAQMIGALLFVIGLMYILLKFISKKTKSYHSARTLQNIGGVPLGNHKSVQLVKVGNRLLVVGVGDSIHLLKEIKNEEEIQEILNNEDGQNDEAMEKATDWLQTKILRKKQDDDNVKPFQSLLNSRLGELKEAREQAGRREKEREQ